MMRKTEKLLGLLMFFFVALLAVVFPLFVKDGYLAMATNKFHFFRGISVLLLVVAPVGLVCRGIEGIRSRDQESGFSFSLTDWFVLFYGVVVLLSYFTSYYREESIYGSALWGSRGWNMGLVTQLAFVLIYFCVSRFFRQEKAGILLLLAASVPIFLLGICNRFGWYPIPMEGADPGFISTLGNINWYCGYFSVVFPLGIGLYLHTKGSWQKALLAGYVLLGFAAGITQGSDSGFLVIGLLFLVFWGVCLKSNTSVRKLLEVLQLFCLSGQLIRVFRLLFPEQFNYDTPLTHQLTCTDTTLFLFGILCCVDLLLRIMDKRGCDGKILWKSLRLAGFGVVVLGVVGYLVLLVLNTRYPLRTPYLNGHPLFTFNSEYMNGRGTTWQTGIGIFLSLPLWNRLVGVGPDCFAAYAYQSYDGVWMLREQFGNLLLTNAHNEWITLLVNTGLWGCISYGAAFVTLIGRSFLEKRKAVSGTEKTLLFACGLSILCYMVHNMVSFQQIISTPLVFLVMGMAEGILRRKKTRENEAEE